MKLLSILAAVAIAFAGLFGPIAPAVAADITGVATQPVRITMPRSELELVLKCLAGLDGVAATSVTLQGKHDGSTVAGWNTLAAADYNAADNGGAGVRWNGTVSGITVAPGAIDALEICKLGLEAKASGWLPGDDITDKP